MKVNDDLALIKLPMSFGGQVRELVLSLILDPHQGAVLVDTGLPGQEDEILAAAAAVGVQPGDIKRIVLTHHDIDHLGSAAAVKERTGASLLAFETEVPYVQGEKPGQKFPSPERLAQMPEFAAVIEKLKHPKVDEAFHDGDVLDLAGGVKIVATPGHTVGHVSLYLERTKTLITGDALVSHEGTLMGPMEQATPDMASALESVKRLAELDVDTIVCYHGGLVTEDADGQLKKLAASL